jgi:hypothetical protein
MKFYIISLFIFLTELLPFKPPFTMNYHSYQNNCIKEFNFNPCFNNFNNFNFNYFICLYEQAIKLHPELLVSLPLKDQYLVPKMNEYWARDRGQKYCPLSNVNPITNQTINHIEAPYRQYR